MKTKVSFRAAALLLVLSIAFTVPPSAHGKFVCPTGERMMCYAADGLDLIKTEDCIPDFDKVLDRAMMACLMNWSKLKGNRVYVSDPVYVPDDTDKMKQKDKGNENDKGGRQLQIIGLNTNINNTTFIQNEVGDCRKCVKDCTITLTCTDRRRRVRALRSEAEAETKEKEVDSSKDEEYERVDRSLMQQQQQQQQQRQRITKTDDGHYDYASAARCLDTVLTFEAQPFCPGAVVSNGVFGDCPP